MKAIKNHAIVIDHDTKLMWQQSNLPPRINSFGSAQNWIIHSNRIAYASFSDWRLPTFEEGLTILEQNQKQRQDADSNMPEIFLNPIFSYMQSMWAVEEGNKTYIINFLDGMTIETDTFGSGISWVRGIRDNK